MGDWRHASKFQCSSLIMRVGDVIVFVIWLTHSSFGFPVVQWVTCTPVPSQTKWLIDKNRSLAWSHQSDNSQLIIPALVCQYGSLKWSLSYSLNHLVVYLFYSSIYSVVWWKWRFQWEVPVIMLSVTISLIYINITDKEQDYNFCKHSAQVKVLNIEHTEI